MAKSTKIRKGNDLMIFINGENTTGEIVAGGAGKSVAFATNHTLTFNTEMEEIQSKDSGYNGSQMAMRTTWEIQSENLYIDGEYETLLDYQLGRKYVNIVWGVAKDGATSGTATPEKGITATDQMAADGWQCDTTYTYYSGVALISSLTLNTNAGENATYSVTLTGSGDFRKTAGTN